MKRIAALAAVGMLCVVLSSGAFAAPGDKKAAAPYALIFGTVYGPDQTPVYGATVHIRRADGKKLKGGELHSDHQGEFALRVPAGEADYLVHADLKTDAGKRLSAESKVHISNDERVDIGLHLTE